MLICRNCKEEILDDEYFKCLNNCLRRNFFDTEEENIFCSQECFCDYMKLTLFEYEDDEDE